ncbi:hypothetical protein [Staphylococcus croceilyticus]|uniref:hypothetical protein n=1 Tax=Staphylococcus croceilyticus TaxID=319942 RepID=UPI001432DEC4|nr:hypothetical protein [Staphylococcus croceilyticus]
MILIMLSPLLIIGFIALSIREERKRNKKEQEKKAELEKEKNKISNPDYDEQDKE